MYAIIDLQGHQYIVKQGDKIVVDRMSNEVGEEVVLDKVLALFDESGTNVTVGEPFVKKATVKLKVLDNVKGDKMYVLKFKRKTRYQRKYGFRALQTILQVEELKS